MTTEIEVAKPVRLDQLAREVGERFGTAPVPMWARGDGNGGVRAVAAEVDERDLAECVEAHEADWTPTPTPVDLLEAAIEEASAGHLRDALREHLIPILRDLERRR